MRSFRHWTPRYIYDRLALMRHERVHPDWPWLTADMIGLLDGWLRPTDVGLEFGSGRSTAWFACRVGRLTSVEHNPGWYGIVTEKLRALGDETFGKVDYRLCEDGAGELGDCSYVEVARQAQRGGLDFCLVDGVARDHCALACLDKLKPGGILIIDNVNWYLPRKVKSRAPNSRGLADGCASAVWDVVREEIKDWRCIWTTNGVWDTACWVKPV